MKVLQPEPVKYDETPLKEGDVVRLRCGSPNMVLVKVPRDSKQKATCFWYDDDSKGNVEMKVPLMALESTENQQIRLHKHQALFNGMRLVAVPADSAPDGVLVMGFEDAEARQNFITQFAGEFPAKMMN